MDAPKLLIERIESLSLAGSGRRRDILIPEDHRRPGFDAGYDTDTLYYDAVALPGGLTLVAPKLHGLGDLPGGLTVDGRPVPRAVVRPHRRYDLVQFPGLTGERIALSLDGWSAGSGVSAPGTGLFAGLNVALTLQKENRPEWIAAWLRWHRDRHGLNAALIFDNGSSYGPEAVREAVAPLDLARVVVVSAPQPYGGLARGGGAKFLQSALLNLARLRWLSQAAAVLQCDVDEFVAPHLGPVVERLARSRLGLVPMAGRWLLPRPDATEPLRHADHTHVDPAGAPRCPPKYLIRPSGPLRRFSWEVHGLERFPSLKWLTPKRPGYWHFRGITTNWNWDRTARPQGLRPDPEAQAEFGG